MTLLLLSHWRGQISPMMNSTNYLQKEIEKMAYQHVVVMSVQPRLVKRIPFPRWTGKSRILLHLFKVALGSLRYGSKNNLTKNTTASTLCFTASNNQLNNCTKVFGDDADTEIIHFPGAQKQDKFNNLMVFRLSSCPKYFWYLLKRLKQHQNEIEKILWEKNNKCFDYICDIFFVEFFLNKFCTNAKKVIINTDLSAFGNTVGYYYSEKKIPVTYLPHSPLLKIKTPVYYNTVVCRSKKEIEERHSWLSQQGIFDIKFDLRERKIAEGRGIGIIVKPEDSFVEIENILRDLPAEVYLRPHPMIKDTTQWKKLTDKLQVNFSNPNDEDVDHFLSKINTICGRLSGLHKELLQTDGNRAYIIATGPLIDNYGVTLDKSSKVLNNWSEFVDILKQKNQENIL